MSNSSQQFMGLLMQGGSQSPPSNLTLPSVSGTVQQGQVLTASPGTWQGVPNPTILTIVWQSAPPPSFSTWTQVFGSSSTYTPVAGDVGNEIRVVVTATNGVSPDGVENSLPVGPVQPAPPQPVPPPPIIT